MNGTDWKCVRSHVYISSKGGKQMQSKRGNGTDSRKLKKASGSLILTSTELLNTISRQVQWCWILSSKPGIWETRFFPRVSITSINFLFSFLSLHYPFLFSPCNCQPFSTHATFLSNFLWSCSLFLCKCHRCFQFVACKGFCFLRETYIWVQTQPHSNK